MNDEQDKKTITKRSNKFSLLFILFVLLTLGIVVWQFFDMQRNELHGSDDVKMQLAELQQQQNDWKQQLAHYAKQLDELAQRQSAGGETWFFDEMTYLLNLADLQLRVFNNTRRALVLLNEVQQRIAGKLDPSLAPFAKALAKQIIQLKSIDVLDEKTLLDQFEQVIKKLPDLPLKQQSRKMSEKITNHNIDTKQTWVEKIKQALAQLITVKHHDDILQPLLSEQNRLLLKENLQLLLQQAKFSALQAHQLPYQEAIEQTERWVNHYFDTSDKLTQQVLAELAQLKQAAIDPAVPDVKQLIDLFDQFKKRENL